MCNDINGQNLLVFKNAHCDTTSQAFSQSPTFAAKYGLDLRNYLRTIHRQGQIIDLGSETGVESQGYTHQKILGLMVFKIQYVVNCQGMNPSQHDVVSRKRTRLVLLFGRAQPPELLKHVAVTQR